MINIVKWVTTRAVFYYFLCFLLIIPFLDFNKLKSNAITQTMSRYVPPISYFKDFDLNPLNQDSYKLNWCVDYHLRVANYFKYQASEAYAMAAFCSYRLGKILISKEYYKKSLDLNSEFFWTSYNLALINYKQSNYLESVNLLKESIAKDIKVNLLMILRSKVYSDVLNSDGKGNDLYLRFIKGYLDASILMIQSLYNLKEYSSVITLSTDLINKNIGSVDVFYIFMGKSFLSIQSPDKALNCFQLALQANPNNKDALLYIENIRNNETNVIKVEDSAVQELLIKGVRFF